MSIKGTSISTPTTVARAAPEERPKSMAAVAMATSKWLEAPIRAEGAASRGFRFAPSPAGWDRTANPRPNLYCACPGRG